MAYSVLVTEQQRNMLNEYAKGRNSSKHPSWTRRKSNVFSDQEADLQGLIGEFVVCNFFNVDFDRSIHSYGDSGHDLIVNGTRIGVKCNHRAGGFLMVEPDYRDKDGLLYNFKSDVMFLVCGTCDPLRKICNCRNGGDLEWRIEGWITREDFMRKNHVKNLKLGDRHICTIQQLNHNLNRKKTVSV